MIMLKSIKHQEQMFKIYVLALVGSPIEPSSNQTETTRNFSSQKTRWTAFQECVDKILRLHFNDDKTYVKNDLKQLFGQKFYISTIRGKLPDRYKFVCQEKYAKN
jgi:hypothetical protein